jgi:hypothetical protein
MQFVSFLRRVAPVVALVAVVLMASCNNGSKKYGCPNHLSVPKISLR